MEKGIFRLESHVAQQIQRDKLRFQQNSVQLQHLDDFPNSLEQLTVHSELNPDLVQVRDVKNAAMLYDPTVLSSEMLNFAASSSVTLSTQRATLMEQDDLSVVQPGRSVKVQDSSLANMSQTVLSNFNSSPKISTNGDPHGCGDWRRLDSQHNYDWTVNCASGSVGRESNQKSLFVAEILSNNSRVSNFSTSAQCLKPCNFNGYQDVRFQCNLTNPLSEICGQDVQKQYCKDMQFASHSSLHGGTSRNVSYASDEGNQLILLSSCGNQSTGHIQHTNNAWIHRPIENCNRVLGHPSLLSRESNQELEVISHDANTQGLSLSLSSNPSSKQEMSHFGEGYEFGCQAKAGGVCMDHQNFILGRSSYLCPMARPSIVSKSYGKSLHDIVGTTSAYFSREAGPLGPFTGYASILKSSRFLMPAQELLDEFCSVAGSKLMKMFEVSSADQRVSEEVSASASADAVNAAGAEAGVKDNNGSGTSCSTFHSSSEGNADGRIGSSSCESYRPEYHREKARLLYLQDEVCRRYKQYHQHMQMVASSFESVAGLSAATPYMSVALRTVTRNFRCLKHAISDQLKRITKALGENFSSPNTGASSSKCDTSTSRLRYIDQGFQNHKFVGANVGFPDPQRVWRPQRGLPERAVAILRAWLFEHFLHPYPTDADKHMLATQTGLSRNQVSNWFINARVRVWKPMVEEIHMLETQNLADTNQTAMKVDGHSADGTGHPNNDQLLNKTATNSTVDNKQLGCSSRGSSMGSEEEQQEAEKWGQLKRTRIDFHIPTAMDGSLMNVLPYHRSGIDIGGGLGAVTLTLGLRHGVENVQQQHQRQQLQQHDNQLRRPLGSQMIRDFVG